MNMAKLIFSVTAADCRFDYFRGSGAGGQHRNKTDSAVRCTHIASGAVGTAQDTGPQHENTRLPFRRMAESRQFMAWHKIEVARRTGRDIDARSAVDRAMAPRNLRVDVHDENGRWVLAADDMAVT